MDISCFKYQGVLKMLDLGVTCSEQNSIYSSIPYSKSKGCLNFSASAKKLFIIHWLKKLGTQHDPMPHRDYIRLYYRTIQHVYDVYQLEYEDRESFGDMPQVSYSYFCYIWRCEIGNSIRVRGDSTQFTKCDVCETLKRERIQRCRTETEKADNMMRQQKHDTLNRNERIAYDLRKQESRQEPDKVLHLSWDGADQAAYALPYFTNPDKESVKIYKTTMYLVGVRFYGGDLRDFVFHHLPIFDRGANCSIEVLHRMLTKVYEKKGRLPKKLYIQLDNCWRENKNKYLFAFLGELVYRGIFDEVIVSFLCKGHTHNENDQTFSVIATYLRNHNDIYCVEDFLKALAAAQQEPCPIDVSRLWGCAPISQYIKKKTHCWKLLKGRARHSNLKLSGDSHHTIFIILEANK